MPNRCTPLALVAAEALPHRPGVAEAVGRAAGPGWFESSWDLHRGLEVREAWSDDERVDGWIVDFLATRGAGCHAAPPRGGVAIA